MLVARSADHAGGVTGAHACTTVVKAYHVRVGVTGRGDVYLRYTRSPYPLVM